MDRTVSRRSLLAGGLAAAGTLALAAGPLRRAVRTAAPGEEPRRDRSGDAPALPVAVVRCESYEPREVRTAMDRVLGLIGGVKDLVENRTVAVKLNLTGLTWDPVFGLPARETYQTQPATVAALCAILAEAGARRIVLVENLYWERPFEQSLSESGWDVRAIQEAGHHKVHFEDTRNRGAFRGYSRLRVPWGGFAYPAFDFNERFEQTDVLISLAKLKQHATAGITGVIKNCFGNTPTALYGDTAPDERGLIHRAAQFHAGRKGVPAGVPPAHEDLPRIPTVRVPRVTADIFGARPSDLGIVDGVRSISGGEGHWNRGIALVEPKLLIAGRNGVCTDAICTAVMGFDPMAPHGRGPFPGENHLKLLASVGVGTHDPARIEVRGLALDQARYPYRPAPRS
jgi:uncharacterized protein (DUF362 family)